MHQRLRTAALDTSPTSLHISYTFLPQLPPGLKHLALQIQPSNQLEPVVDIWEVLGEANSSKAMLGINLRRLIKRPKYSSANEAPPEFSGANKK